MAAAVAAATPTTAKTVSNNHLSAAASVKTLATPNFLPINKKPSAPLLSSSQRRPLLSPPSSSSRPLSYFFPTAPSSGDIIIGGDRSDDDKPREECGVVGVIGDPEASRLAYLALHALQHRGQEGAGIVCSDNGKLCSVTGLGLVSEVFNKSKLDSLPGSSAIGHVRYSTAGAASSLLNVQPFLAGYRFGHLAVAHNGNLVNYKKLRSELEDQGAIFNTSSDTEVVLHLIAHSKSRPFVQRLVEACEALEGAYSLVFLTEDKLFAVRDPRGFRPLVMGRRRVNGAIVFASETCALDLLDVMYEREVNPGEVVMVESGEAIPVILTYAGGPSVRAASVWTSDGH